MRRRRKNCRRRRRNGGGGGGDDDDYYHPRPDDPPFDEPFWTIRRREEEAETMEKCVWYDCLSSPSVQDEEEDAPPGSNDAMAYSSCRGLKEVLLLLLPRRYGSIVPETRENCYETQKEHALLETHAIAAAADTYTATLAAGTAAAAAADTGMLEF